ncbi:hypothetical protein [Bacillus velezensis]|uniref:hypothetical protein n=1 Tax=Bacillus velezensis TaxID=492670 RepID=UPI002E14311A
MKNVFELKLQLLKDCNKLDSLIQKGKEFLEIVPDLESELLKLYKKLHESHIAAAGINMKGIMEGILNSDFTDEGLDSLRQRFTELKKKNITRYSPFNLLPTYKRFFRGYQLIRNNDLPWEIERASNKVGATIIELERLISYSDKGVEELSSEADKVFDELINYRPVFVSVMPYINTIFAIHDNKVKKHDILNFLSIDKSPDTLKAINEYPDYITLEDFENMIFVDYIECEKEAYVHESMTKEAMREIKNNKELREKVYEATGINRMPTYSIYQDGEGNTYVKQNPPNLELVKQ